VSRGCQVDAQLVRPAGLQPELDQCCMSLVVNGLVVGYSGLGIQPVYLAFTFIVGITADGVGKGAIPSELSVNS